MDLLSPSHWRLLRGFLAKEELNIVQRSSRRLKDIVAVDLLYEDIQSFLNDTITNNRENTRKLQKKERFSYHPGMSGSLNSSSGPSSPRLGGSSSVFEHFFQQREDSEVEIKSPYLGESMFDITPHFQNAQDKVALNDRLIKQLQQKLNGAMKQRQTLQGEALLEHLCMLAWDAPVHDFLDKYGQTSLYPDININTLNAGGQTILYCACSGNNFDLVFLLLTNPMFASINLNPQVTGHRSTPLHAACFFGYNEIAGMLMLRGADITIQNYRGRTPKDEIRAPELLRLVTAISEGNLSAIDKGSYGRIRSIIKERKKALLKESEQKKKAELKERRATLKGTSSGKLFTPGRKIEHVREKQFAIGNNAALENDPKQALTDKLGISCLWWVHDVDTCSGEKAVEFVQACLGWLRKKRAYLQPGIFRHSGNERRIQELIELTWNGVIEFPDDEQEHTISNLLKRFLRFLEKPLLTFGLYKWWLAALSAEQDSVNDHLREVIQMLPPTNTSILKDLCLFWEEVAQHSDVNHMDPSNLAVVTQPCIFKFPRTTLVNDQFSSLAELRGKDVIEHLITHAKELFGEAPPSRAPSVEVVSKTLKYQDLSVSMQGKFLKRQQNSQPKIVVAPARPTRLPTTKSASKNLNLSLSNPNTNSLG